MIVYADVCPHPCVANPCADRIHALWIWTNGGDGDDGGGVWSDPDCGLGRGADAVLCRSSRAVSPDPPPMTFQNPPEPYSLVLGVTRAV